MDTKTMPSVGEKIVMALASKGRVVVNYASRFANNTDLYAISNNHFPPMPKEFLYYFNNLTLAHSDDLRDSEVKEEVRYIMVGEVMKLYEQGKTIDEMKEKLPDIYTGWIRKTVKRSLCHV